MMAEALHPVRQFVRQRVQEVLATLPPDSELRQLREKLDPAKLSAFEDAVLFLRDRIAGPSLRNAPSPRIKALLVLGKHPRTLARGLTKHEACAWVLQSEHKKPVAWLWSRLCEEHAVLRDVRRPDTIAVVRWVRRLMESPVLKGAALRNRTDILGEAAVGGRVIDRLDEISPGDLFKSPTRTLEMAHQRVLKENWEGPDELIKEEVWHQHLPQGIQILRCFSDLYREGIQMRHCVASYAPRVSEGKTMVFSVQTGTSRSTVEFQEGQLMQHKGFANSQPPPECVAVVLNLLKSAPWERGREYLS